jgi:FRG domain-containing protein
MGRHLLPPSENNWQTLFLMQHHGLPTRLLDWTTNFAVALFFATKGNAKSPTIWILDPYALNSRICNRREVIHLESDFPIGYEDYFVEDSRPSFGSFPSPFVAIAGNSQSTRMHSQQGHFTLHTDLQTSLDDGPTDAGRWKLVVPPNAVDGAKGFLQLAGITEYSLFPDLDGLGRHLLLQEFG